MNCFNGERYLDQAVQSVLEQSYDNWEIIFWDNQSTDGSADIFRSYSDSRFKYWYAPEHTRLYEARNCALERSSGEVVAFLDTDDWWLPHKLADQVPRFVDPEVGLVCSNWWNKSEVSGKEWKGHSSKKLSGFVFHELLRSYWVGLVTLVIRRSAIESLDYWCDPKYQIIGDFDLVVRLAHQWKLDYSFEPLACYRVHESSLMARSQDLISAEMEDWFDRACSHEPMASSPNLMCVKWSLIYIRAMGMLSDGERAKAFELWKILPWRRLRFKLGIALLIPSLVTLRGRSTNIL